MNKKRLIIFVLVAIAIAFPAMANPYATGVDNGADLMKFGAYVGSPLLATAGFEFNDGGMEINVHAGYSYGYYGGYYGYYGYYGGFIVGANALFTIAEINFGGGIFPMAIGPQVDLRIGYGGSLGLDVLAVWRWEYTFWFPLNVYIQFGGGLGVDFGSSKPFGFAWTSGVGARYVFGM